MILPSIAGPGRSWFLLVCGMVLLIGCQDQDIRENGVLAGEVMEIHDIAMAKMTRMHELKLRLQALEQASGETPETAAAITALQQAHQEMMRWMRAYKPPQTEQELKVARDYLLAEKQKIRQVSDKINASIDRAEGLL